MEQMSELSWEIIVFFEPQNACTNICWHLKKNLGEIKANAYVPTFKLNVHFTVMKAEKSVK